MSVISVRHIIPLTGKTDLATERARAYCGIMARCGARTRFGKVIAGAGAGQLRIFGGYESFTHASQTTEKLASDPAALKLMQERELNPAGEVIGPFVARRIYGTSPSEYSIALQREYQMPRANLPKAIEMMPEIEALGGESDVKVTAVAPVFAEGMDRIVISYWYKSMEALGDGIDTVGMSEEFQSIVMRASELGTLSRSRVVMII